MLNPLGVAARLFLAEKSARRASKPEQAEPDVDPLDFDSDDFESSYLGWEIARCAPCLGSDDQRTLAALAAACLASIRSGSTRLSVEGTPLAAALAAVGAGHAGEAARALLDRAARGDPAVAAVIGRPGERKPLILEHGWLYTERMYVLEDRFCTHIERRLADLPGEGAQALLFAQARGAGREPAIDARAVSRAVQAIAVAAQLTEEQKRAVREALRSRLTLIQGGPGTGKTTAVVALIRAVTWLGTPIEALAVAAPTGKAAQRISAAIAHGLAPAAGDLSDAALREYVPTPLTLHRLLGWSPRTGRFAHHENDTLPHRLVIVDEASMIDLALMDRLIRALRPDARLVLLGDADQLPSVEAGAVFRDLCAALGAVRLTTNLRVASIESARGIITAAQAVNAGNLRAPLDASVERRREAGEVAFTGVEHLDCGWSAVGEDILERWWTRIATDELARLVFRTYRASDGRIEAADAAELRALFVHHARARILCATRLPRFVTSAEEVNRFLTGRLREASPRLPYAGDHLAHLPIGTPFATLARGDRFDALPLDSLTDLAPAFAMTVHKAQGSEFDHVMLVLPEKDIALLTRELVYTAMTRARRSVLIVGDGVLLDRAVGRTTIRHCGIAERLDRSRAE
jgi:exodeoxyribonuclease V alpha subunit